MWPINFMVFMRAPNALDTSRFFIDTCQKRTRSVVFSPTESCRCFKTEKCVNIKSILWFHKDNVHVRFLQILFISHLVNGEGGLMQQYQHILQSVS